jgi:hypothetical protein
MSQQLHALTHGLNGVILGYLIVLIPRLLGLRQVTTGTGKRTAIRELLQRALARGGDPNKRSAAAGTVGSGSVAPQPVPSAFATPPLGATSSVLLPRPKHYEKPAPRRKRKPRAQPTAR